MSKPNIPSLRTPPERFEYLPGFPYQPHYLKYGSLRMAYIDEKTGDGKDTFLCVHGQPTWSYLYRKMIPVLLNHSTLSNPPSRRVVAPDLFGFGRSDKPSRESEYHFNLHRESLLYLIRTLDLTNITLVVQDWGGILGLTLPIQEPSRIKRLLVMNTTIGVGAPPTQGFLEWKAYCNRTPDMKVSGVMDRSCRQLLSKEELEAYDAPFPDVNYKAGVRSFPNMVMIREDQEGVDISKKCLQDYRTSDHFQAEDIFMAVGMQDPVLGAVVMRKLARVWKNGCYYMEIGEAGHFVQEWGDKVARTAIEVFEKQGAVNGVRRIIPEKASL